jgi:hypothetical protein
MNNVLPKAEVQSLTEEAHNEFVNLLKENLVRHTYHIVDGWGLYSTIFVWTNNPSAYISGIHNLKLTYQEQTL